MIYTPGICKFEQRVNTSLDIQQKKEYLKLYQTCENWEIKQNIEDCILAIKDTVNRDILYMHFIKGLTFMEIKDCVNFSERQVMRRYNKAIENLNLETDGDVLFEIVCQKCGKRFEHSTCYKKYCSECYMALKKDNGHFIVRSRGGQVAVKTVHEVILSLETYNKKHGTNLTYGQYVSMVESIGTKKRGDKKCK